MEKRPTIIQAGHGLFAGTACCNRSDRMVRKQKAALGDLEARLGYKFRDSELAARALTHLSAPATGGQGRLDSYQRLEFLGDRVLGLVVAEMLYEAFPQASEGELSMRLAAWCGVKPVRKSPR